MLNSNTKIGEGFNPSSRISNITVSEILKIDARANFLNKQGKPIVNLGIGEPDFDTPLNIKQAAKIAIDNGQTSYTALTGTPELKMAIQDKFKRDNQIEYALDEIIVSTGAKQILYNAFMASLEQGDEVIIPAPYWTSYADIIKICGGVPVIIDCGEDTNFLLTADDLEKAITNKTRWILFNSPSNPSGATYSEKTYRPLLNIILKYPKIWILADDIYEHIIYDGVEFVTPAQIEPKLKQRILTCNGVSKAYAMTGWRIGYGGGPKDLIKAMSIVQSQATSCPSSISQTAAVEALSGSQDEVYQRVELFKKRRNFVVSELNKLDNITCSMPSGAFYTFASCKGLIGKTTPNADILNTDSEICQYFLEQVHVAIVPGSCFGISPYFRISYAASQSNLSNAIERIGQAISKLK